MHDVEIRCVDYVKRVDLHIGHEPDAWKLAHKLGVTVEPGDENGLSGNIIPVQHHLDRTSQAQPIIRHEIGHSLLQLSDTEDEIFNPRNSCERGLPSIEKLCYHAALILHIEDRHLEQAHNEHGNTPEAIVRIADLAEVSVVDALHRWVYAWVGGRRAAWIIRGRRVVETARSDDWLPFWLHSELQDPREELPNAILQPLEGKDVMGVACCA
jgi:hypothetical protein